MWPSHQEKSGSPNALPGINPHSRPSDFQAWSLAQTQGSQLLSEGPLAGLQTWQAPLSPLLAERWRGGLFQRGPGNLTGGTHTLGTGSAGLGPLLTLNILL